jgi:hypothetical protein
MDSLSNCRAVRLDADRAQRHLACDSHEDLAALVEDRARGISGPGLPCCGTQVATGGTDQLRKPPL